VSAWTDSRDRARERAVADPSLIPHGTPSGYHYWGCHCRECAEARRLCDAANDARARIRDGRPLTDFARTALADYGQRMAARA
jgi:hypothetical protein